MKGTYYALITLPTVILLVTRKINLAALYRDHHEVFLLAIPLVYWTAVNLWSNDPDTFSSYARRSATTFIFIIAVAHIVSTQKQALFRFMDFVLALVALGALIHLASIFSPEPRDLVWRLGDNSIFASSLHAAHYFGFFAVYGIVRFYQQPPSRASWAYVAAVVPCLLFMLMTFSRGPLISLFLVYLFIAIYWFRKYSHALIALAVAAATTIILLEPLLQRGSSFRLEIWQGAVELIQQNLWLGVGFGEWLDLPYGDGLLAPHAHNLFLEMWVRSGVLGLVLLLIIVGYVAYKAVRAKPAEQLCVATLLFFFASMMTDVTRLINSPSSAYVVIWLPLTALLVLASSGKPTPLTSPDR